MAAAAALRLGGSLRPKAVWSATAALRTVAHHWRACLPSSLLAGGGPFHDGGGMRRSISVLKSLATKDEEEEGGDAHGDAHGDADKKGAKKNRKRNAASEGADDAGGEGEGGGEGGEGQRRVPRMSREQFLERQDQMLENMMGVNAEG